MVHKILAELMAKKLKFESERIDGYSFSAFSMNALLPQRLKQ